MEVIAVITDPAQVLKILRHHFPYVFWRKRDLRGMIAYLYWNNAVGRLCKAEDTVGEGRKHGLRVDFGLLACRELDSALGLTEIAEACPHDARNGKNTRQGI